MRKTKKKFKPIMRHFVYCAALAAAVFFLAGCGGNPNKKNASETQTSETQSSVMEVDNLLADAEKLTGGKVTVEGVCTLAEWELRLKDQIARQHGEGEAGCSAEHQARGESVASSTEKRIADFRARIADRKAKEGKEYLSFYHVDGGSYEVLK